MRHSKNYLEYVYICSTLLLNGEELLLQADKDGGISAKMTNTSTFRHRKPLCNRNGFNPRGPATATQTCHGERISGWAARFVGRE
jgi:hypothetical protein